MNKQLSSIVAKDRISENLLCEIREELNGNPITNNLAFLDNSIGSRKKLIESKKMLQDLKDILSETVFSTAIQEIEEIENDGSWNITDHSVYISEINDWASTFYTEFCGMSLFDGIVLGCHSEREVVYITGKMSNQDCRSQLIQYITSKQPPRKLLIDVTFSQ